jgi:hypothetical protein
VAVGNVSNLAEAREARRLQQPRTNDGKGFALLHRKIMDVPFYKDAEAAHLWFTCSCALIMNRQWYRLMSAM